MELQHGLGKYISKNGVLIDNQIVKIKFDYDKLVLAPKEVKQGVTRRWNKTRT